MVAIFNRVTTLTGLLAVSLTAALAASTSPAAAAGNAKNGFGRCGTGRLTITAGEPDGAAGTWWLPLRFTNTSSRSCTIAGYPRVAYVTAPDGERVNDWATPEADGPVQVIVLAPGATAVAVLRMPQAVNYDEQVCQPVPVAGLRVAPPRSRAAVFLSMPTLACSVDGLAALSIRALEPA